MRAETVGDQGEDRGPRREAEGEKGTKGQGRTGGGRKNRQECGVGCGVESVAGGGEKGVLRAEVQARRFGQSGAVDWKCVRKRRCVRVRVRMCLWRW